jgi:hypothetical protein
MKNTVLFVALVAGSLLAQTPQDQSQQGTTDKSGKVTMQGCVSRSGSDFILMQTNPGNSYVLQGSREIKLEQFLGHQVEVTGTEKPTMSTSSNFTQRRAGSPVTITLKSIRTVSKQCGS